MQRIVAHLMASAAVFAASSTYAQEAPAESKVIGIDTILVTANRVEESAQDTPVSLNVYSGDDLAELGVNSVRDLALIDPSVNVSPVNGVAYVAVRGVASTDVTELSDPSVPISRDGFFTNRAFSINTSMYDVARIEVLKGPQGTLQGRNSTGGLVSIVTNRPEFRNSAYATATFGNYDTVNAEAGVNFAVSDSLAIRASGVVLTHDGYRERTGSFGNPDDEDFISGRIQARFSAGDFELWTSYQHDDRNVNGAGILKGDLGGPVPDFSNIEPFPGFAPTSTSLTGDRVRLEASYYAPWGLNFIYSGGWDSQNSQLVLDATGPGYPANRQYLNGTTADTWNHELRISNDEASRLFFQAGYFRFEEDLVTDAGVFNREMTGLFAPGGALANVPGADQSFRYGIKFDYEIATRSDALFAQVQYDLSDQLEVALGGRYTWDEKVRTGQAVLQLPALAFPLCAADFPVSGCPPFPITTPGQGSTKEGRPTWHLGLNWRPNPDMLVFTRYDRGYKSGGFNSNGSAAATPYDAEEIDSFELGMKNTLLDNSLQLNGSVFYSRYRGYQASQSSCPTCSAGVFNVGSVDIFGIEGQVVALVAERTNVNLNATYLTTEFGDNIIVRNGNDEDVDISGNQLPNAPHFTATVAFEQGFALDNDHELSFRADGKYSSSYYFSAFNLPDVRTEASFLANTSVTLEPVDGPWSVQLFVRNVFDSNVLAFAERNFVANINGYQFQPPRTYGLRVSVSY